MSGEALGAARKHAGYNVYGAVTSLRVIDSE